MFLSIFKKSGSKKEISLLKLFLNLTLVLLLLVVLYVSTAQLQHSVTVNVPEHRMCEPENEILQPQNINPVIKPLLEDYYTEQEIDTLTTEIAHNLTVQEVGKASSKNLEFSLRHFDSSVLDLTEDDFSVLLTEITRQYVNLYTQAVASACSVSYNIPNDFKNLTYYEQTAVLYNRLSDLIVSISKQPVSSKPSLPVEKQTPPPAFLVETSSRLLPNKNTQAETALTELVEISESILSVRQYISSCNIENVSPNNESEEGLQSQSEQVEFCISEITMKIENILKDYNAEAQKQAKLITGNYEFLKETNRKTLTHPAQKAFSALFIAVLTLISLTAYYGMYRFVIL